MAPAQKRQPLVTEKPGSSSTAAPRLPELPVFFPHGCRIDTIKGKQFLVPLTKSEKKAAMKRMKIKGIGDGCSGPDTLNDCHNDGTCGKGCKLQYEGSNGVWFCVCQK